MSGIASRPPDRPSVEAKTRPVGAGQATLRRILFPTDLSEESEAAFAHAQLLAEAFGATLSLYHAVEAPHHDEPHWAFDSAQQIWRAAERMARHDLERTAADLGVRHEIQVERCICAHRALVDLILASHPDLVVMATHGREGLAHLFLGSVTEKVVQHGHRPVLCVRRGPRGGALPYRRILVPTDFSPAARRAFPLAALLARTFGAEVLAFHAVPERTLATLERNPRRSPACSFGGRALGPLPARLRRGDGHGPCGRGFALEADRPHRRPGEGGPHRDVHARPRLAGRPHRGQPHREGGAARALPRARGVSVSLKSVALPAEHGGWGFLIEPLIVGLAVAPTWPGAAIAAAALGAFLARHPLKLALADRQRGRAYPRTRAAWAFVFLYAVLAALAFALAWSASAARFWPPLLAAAPAALLQLYYDVQNRGRELAPELLGALATGSAAAAITLAGGWPAGPALLLWLLLATRAAAAILYVRTRLRLDRGQEPDRLPAAASHAGALALVAALAGAGLVPWLCVLAFAVLLARAAHGMSAWRRRLRPQAVGFQELGYGLLTAVLLAFAYSAG